MTQPTATSKTTKWTAAAAWALLVAMGLLWWSTAVSTSMARISAMQVVEPYAFAVYHQIVHNLSMTGDFFQTIHQGYDDSWTWSGHRAPALFPVALLYRLDPTVFGLARLQILLVLLGAIPAGLLCRRAAGNAAGLVAGAALYLFSPPVLALALQDYQDMVLALPCLVFVVWSLQADKAWWLPLGIAVGLLPREETVPIVVALAVLTVPWDWSGKDRVRWRRWALNIGVTVGLVGAYLLCVETAFPSNETAYRTPIISAVTQIGGHSGVIHLDGWPFWDGFYAWMLVPLAALAMLAPNLALPAAGLVLFHLAVPQGHGIDRSWSGHSHHLAPAVALLAVAAAEGAGRLLRLAAHARLGRGRPVAVIVLLLLIVGSVAERFDAHAIDQNFRVTLVPKNPVWVHPAWALINQVPPDTNIAVPRDLAPMISDRRGSFTIDGSLDSKASLVGLKAVQYAVVDARQAEGKLVWWVSGMPGAEKLDESGPFSLWTWAEDAEEDPRWETIRSLRIRKAQTWIDPYNRREDIAGVARFESPEAGRGGHIPRIMIPAWLLR